MGYLSLDLFPRRKFNEQTFDEYYTEYEQYLYTNNPIKYQTVAPLENFDCTSNSSAIELSNDVRIVPANSTFYPHIIEEDLNRWMNEKDPEIQYCFPTKFYLEIDFEMGKEKVPSKCIEQIEHITIEKILEVFKILRLYKEGSFMYSFIYWHSKIPCDPPHDCDDIHSLFGKYYYRPNIYLLQENDVKNLQHLFQKYSNNSNNEDFPHSAIYYLDKGIKENDAADKLVDFTAALESLLLESKQEIATTLAIRTAFFLEQNKQKCKEIYKEMKKAYGFRSKVVHGERDKVKELVYKEFSEKTERYARKAIIKWLDMIDEGKTAKEIYESIEDKLFS